MMKLKKLQKHIDFQKIIEDSSLSEKSDYFKIAVAKNNSDIRNQLLLPRNEDKIDLKINLIFSIEQSYNEFPNFNN